jgi:electron transfer flavoprotein beta subunit
MRVAVCCKGVPIEIKLECVQIDKGDIQFKGTDFYINEFDSYALEAAIALKKDWGAETFALTLGPLRVQEILHFAIAKGIDHVFRIDGETSRQELIANGLISTLKEIQPQLILVGVNSEDWMGGEVGIYLSQALDMGLAYAVTEISELNDTNVRIKKELGGGKKAEVLLQLPAILCIQTGIQPLQYISAVKRRKARKSPIKLGGKLDIETAKERFAGMMAYEAKEISLFSTEGHAEMLTGTRSENASKLIDIISKTL